MKKIIFGAFLSIGINAVAQEPKPSSPITITGYLETYYSYQFNKPLNNTMPSFIYSHNRVNEVNLNLGLVKASYAVEKLRANLSLATGTYMNANYTAEPGVLKNIYEADMGVKLSSKKNIWLDAGIFPSHIGWESAIGKDGPTLSRSLAAENSPYFETGMKLGYTSLNEKWFLSILVLNGWQRIQRVDGNTTPALGTQVTYKPSAKVTLNSSSFVGNDKPDSSRQMRYFHDLYGVFQLSSKLSATAGFDIGWEQKQKGASSLNTWYTPTIIVKYASGAKSSIALRGEYYRDKNGVIIPTGSPNGFRTLGCSASFDYAINNNAMWRFECRNLSNRDKIFIDKNNESVQDMPVISTALAISF